jgi:ACR3 family arsenite efflux pump ArsB
MDEAAHQPVIAISIAIGTGIPLLAGALTVWVAMRTRHGAAAHRDKTVSTLFGIALLLMLLFITAATRIALWGMAYAGLARAALVLTAAFAAAGAVFGLTRALRSGRAIKTQRA